MLHLSEVELTEHVLRCGASVGRAQLYTVDDCRVSRETKRNSQRYDVSWLTAYGERGSNWMRRDFREPKNNDAGMLKKLSQSDTFGGRTGRRFSLGRVFGDRGQLLSSGDGKTPSYPGGNKKDHHYNKSNKTRREAHLRHTPVKLCVLMSITLLMSSIYR